LYASRISSKSLLSCSSSPILVGSVKFFTLLILFLLYISRVTELFRYKKQ
jgi:hypothetical protein